MTNIVEKVRARCPITIQQGRIDWTPKKNGPTHALRYFSAESLLNEKLPQRQYLLHPWLREHESVLLYAQTGVGKSWFALGAAIAVAGGGEFLEWEVESPDTSDGWKVLYVDGEMNQADIQDRLRMLLAGDTSVDHQQVLSNLHILPRQGQSAVRFPCITEDTGVEFLQGIVSKERFDLVVLDNFSTLAAVDDENSASSINDLTNTLLALKSQGVAVMLVHHSGKSGDTYRGSSKIAATFEVILNLQPTLGLGGTGGDSASFTTEFEKMRSGRTPFALRADLVPGPVSGSLCWDCTSDSGGLARTLSEGFKEGRWATQDEAAEDLGVSRAKISRTVNRAIRLGMFTQRQLNQWKSTTKSARQAAVADVIEGAPDF